MALSGIKYIDDTVGCRRYVRIDLKRHGNNQLLEDFLDGQEAMACRGDETVSLHEFNQYIDKRLNTNV